MQRHALRRPLIRGDCAPSARCGAPSSPRDGCHRGDRQAADPAALRRLRVCLPPRRSPLRWLRDRACGAPDRCCGSPPPGLDGWSSRRLDTTASPATCSRALKFGRMPAVAGLIADRIATLAPAAILQGTLVPVPAAPLRLRWRGFDPAAEISLSLAALTGLPVRECLRRRGLRRQVGRPRRERLGAAAPHPVPRPGPGQRGAGRRRADHRRDACLVRPRAAPRRRRLGHRRHLRPAALSPKPLPAIRAVRSIPGPTETKEGIVRIEIRGPQRRGHR